MVNKCCVPNCKTGAKNPNGGYYGSEFSTFRAPSDAKRRLEWQCAIPSAYNKKITELKRVHVICEVHFKADEIVKAGTINYGPNSVLEPYERPSLIVGAIPSLFPSFPEYLMLIQKAKPPPKERNAPLDPGKRRRVIYNDDKENESPGQPLYESPSKKRRIVDFQVVSPIKRKQPEREAIDDTSPSKRRAILIDKPLPLKQLQPRSLFQPLHITIDEEAPHSTGWVPDTPPVTPCTSEPKSKASSDENSTGFKIPGTPLGALYSPSVTLFTQPLPAQETTPKSTSKDSFDGNYAGLELPGGWIQIPIDEYRLSAANVVNNKDGVPQIIKSVKIDLQGNSLDLHNMMGRSLQRFNNPSSFSTFDQLNFLIKEFDEEKMCPGIQNPKYAKLDGISTGKMHEDGAWRSHKCHFIRNRGDICIECNSLENTLRMSTNRSKLRKGKSAVVNKDRTPLFRFRNHRHLTSEQKNQVMEQQQKSNRKKGRKITKLKNKVDVLKKKLLSLKDQISTLSIAKVDEIFASITDKKAQLTVRMILQRAKLKCAKSMRYEADWLLECLLLRTKSSSTYEHLKRTGLIPLPCRNTLRKMLSAMAPSFGFSQFALDAMRKVFQGLGTSIDQQVGVLTLDEVKITQTLDFNTQFHQFDGFAHLDPNMSSEMFVPPEEEDEEEESPPSLTTKHLADHALVFMFRPLKGNWVQPFGAFASVSAASGEQLWKLVVAALIRLEECGARVLSIVCDGAQSNKQMWSLFGLGITTKNGKEKIKNSIIHPTAKNWTVYFILDPPHAFKCIRNQIFNKKIVQSAGKVIWKDHLDKLYFFDSNRLGQLMACPRLTPAHLNPTSFQRMSVRYAVQILSHSVAVALKTYRENEDLNNVPESKRSFHHSEEFEKLILLLDQSFDIVNARIPKKGINISKWEGKDNGKETLQRFDKILKETATFAESKHRDDVVSDPFVSATTNFGLRITIKSFIDIIDYLLYSPVMKMAYVLTGKINQDCLERFFGIIRSAGGGDDKPTVSSFLQLFRMLTLYYPTKALLRGANVDNEERVELLTSYKDWMQHKFKENEEKSRNFRMELKDILLHGIKVILREEEVDLSAEAVFINSTMNEKIIYYICGYINRKHCKKKNGCTECVESISSAFGDLPDNFTAQHLTVNKTKGGLKFASTSLFKLVNTVEQHFLDFCRSGRVFKPHSFSKILYSICCDGLPRVGCDIHYLPFMSTLIYDYLILRFKCVGKRTRIDLCSKSRADKHAKKKQSRL